MLNDLKTVETITGQIRRRRKLCKFLFFIEIQPQDQLTPNSQIFFRSDDHSLDDTAFQDAYRASRPGQVVQVQVAEPHDPTEQIGKPYKVWQSNKPIHIIVPYTDREPFPQDPPLGSTPGKKPTQLIELASGEKKLKSDLVCKYWINKNPCERGDQCLFQHPEGLDFENAKIKWLQEVKKKKNLNIAYLKSLK